MTEGGGALAARLAEHERSSVKDPEVLVIGAGTAGCVVARRLAEQGGKRVMVIEAGPPFPGWPLRVPLASLRLRPWWSWRLESIPQPQLDGRRIPFPMGRVVGGTSSVNAMVAAAGAPADYDAWAGNGGWSWADLRPGWERAISAAGTTALSIRRPVHESAFSTAFIRACEEDGLRRIDALTGAEADTCGMFPLFQGPAGRSSAARYLTHVPRGVQLSLRPRSTVRRLIMDGTRAVGIEIGGRRGDEMILASEAVILCAGTLQSPHILQKSGIGPAKALAAAGIEVAIDLPGVGLNFQDHAGVPVVVESTLPPPGRPAMWLKAAIEYGLFGTGVMASNCCEAGCFLGQAGMTPDVEVFSHFQTYRDPRSVEFSVVLMHPSSRGTIMPDPDNPWGPPRIDPRILESAKDRSALHAGVERLRSIIAQPALQRFGLGAEILPGRLSADAFLRGHASAYYHPVGTCRMGNDPLAVVDPRLRVHGTENVWVVDNSIVPTIPAGHTAATALLIGERAADLLTADLGRS